MRYSPSLDPPLPKVDLVEISFGSNLLVVLNIKLLLRHELIGLCFRFGWHRRRGVPLPFAGGCMDRFKVSW